MADPNNPPPQSKYAPTTPGSTTTTKAKEKRPLEGYSPSELRIQFRKGNIAESEWEGELVARGESVQSAKDAINSALQVGVSQSGTNKGKLTPAEQAAVNAIEYRKPESLDSWESPARAAEGLSSVSPESDAARRAAGGAGGSGSGTGGTGSTTAAKKLPLTPEEEFLKKQQDKVAAQELAARMQRQAEDQYILDSGGKVSRNPETGGLESQTADSSGKYSAVTPHTYDPSTGQITQEAPVGWQHTASQESAQRAAGGLGYGNSLSPEGTWYQNANPETNEALRRMNVNQLGSQIGHNPTPNDLLSPMGGTAALGGGDPTYERNIQILRAAGKVMPSMTNGPGDPVAGSVNQVINKFGDAGGGRVNLLYPDAIGTKLINPDVMSQQEMHDYNLTGSTTPGPAELGGRTMGELETQQAYGSDPAPAAAREAVMANINSGKLFDFDELMRQNGVKAHALGDVDLAGTAALPQMAKDDWLSQNTDTSAILANRGVRGGEGAYGWNSDDGVNYNWQQHLSAAGNNLSNSQNWAAYLGPTSEKRWNSHTGMYENNPNFDEQQSYSRQTNHFPIYGGSHPSTYLNPFGGTYFAKGGTAGAGMDASGSTSTAGPTGLVDLQTGQMKGVYGEDGPEAAVFVPLSKPAKPGLPSMVQQQMMGGGSGGTSTGNPGVGTSQMAMGPTPTELLRQQAKLLRPRVPVRLGG